MYGRRIEQFCLGALLSIFAEILAPNRNRRSRFLDLRRDGGIRGSKIQVIRQPDYECVLSRLAWAEVIIGRAKEI